MPQMLANNTHPSIEYQSHKYCQCDFCSSRSAVNAKKLAVNTLISGQSLRKTEGCCDCSCHYGNNPSTLTNKNNHTSFDGNHPEPINQILLNASRGCDRVGAGNRYTIRQHTAKGARKVGVAPECSHRERSEEENALKELDRLERLLILEHKERVTACLEADRLNALRTMKKKSQPQPLPLDDSVSSTMQQNSLADVNASQVGLRRVLQNKSGYRLTDDSNNRVTIREAYELAHHCPVATVAQCDASHRLQDVLNDVHMVVMDPTNPSNRDSLEEVLRNNHMQPPLRTVPASSQKTQPSAGGDGAKGTTIPLPGTESKNSLASMCTSPHQLQGAGLVWVCGNG